MSDRYLVVVVVVVAAAVVVGGDMKIIKSLILAAIISLGLVIQGGGTALAMISPQKFEYDLFDPQSYYHEVNNILYYDPKGSGVCGEGFGYLDQGVGGGGSGKSIEVGASIYGGNWNGSAFVRDSGDDNGNSATGKLAGRAAVAELANPLGTSNYRGLADAFNLTDNDPLRVKSGSWKGGFKPRAKFKVTYKGKSVIVEKADVGGGGRNSTQTVGGKPKAIDLWYETARLLDFKKGLDVVTVEIMPDDTPTTPIAGGSIVNKAANSAVDSVAIANFNKQCCPVESFLSLDTALTGDNNAEKVFNYLISTPISTNNNKPLSRAQAAGAVGNLVVEAGYGSYDLKTDASNGSHFGIVQWGEPRYSNLKKYASDNGGKWTDLSIQVKFITHELERSESAVIKDSAFKNAEDTPEGAAIAAERWDKFYERSGGSKLDDRKKWAKKALAEFAKDSNSTTDSMLYSQMCASIAGSSDGYVFPVSGTKDQIRKWGNNPGNSGEWADGRYHEKAVPGYYAVDIIAPEGTPIVAFTGGKVTRTKIGSYGELAINILGDDGYIYFYTHLKNSRVIKGDKVSAGSTIAYVGGLRASFYSTPHLHIDKSKAGPPNGTETRGTCIASSKPPRCPIAKAFVPINKELFDSYQRISSPNPM